MSLDVLGHPPHWSLEIFRLASHHRQQQSLRAFERAALPGVHALGVIRDAEWFIIVDAASLAEALRSRQLISTIDPSATRMHSAGQRRRREFPRLV